MTRYKKRMLVWIAVVVAVAVAAVIWNSQAPAPEEMGGTAAKPGSTMPQSYINALAKYDGKRVQFDMYCQAIPKSLSYKNGVSLMLDNRSGDARVIKVGGVSYNLGGYGWRIVTLRVSSNQLPATLPIDCGSARNVSNVLLQQ